MSPEVKRTRKRAGRLGRRLALVLVTVVATTGCRGEGGSDVPERLVDGSLARRAAVRFEGVRAPVLVTGQRSLDLSGALAASRVASCLQASWSSRPAAPVVLRVGVSGESVTFLSRSGRSVQACDGAGDRTSAATWCGHVFGRPVDGRLRDPRLDLGGCTTDGAPLAFVWVEPGPGTRYVVVDRGDYSEAYAVTDHDLPVRVAAAEEVDPVASRAVVHVTEHSSAGRLLRRVELEAVVSG